MSVHGDLLEWATAELVAAGIVAPGSVVRRGRPVWLKGDPDPLIVVSTGSRPETFAGQQTSAGAGKAVTLGFPVLVSYVSQKGFQYIDPVVLADVRAAVRLAVLKLQPIDSVRLALYDPEPVVDMAGFAEGFDISPQLFVFHGNEIIPE